MYAGAHDCKNVTSHLTTISLASIFFAAVCSLGLLTQPAEPASERPCSLRGDLSAGPAGHARGATNESFSRVTTSLLATLSHAMPQCDELTQVGRIAGSDSETLNFLRSITLQPTLPVTMTVKILSHTIVRVRAIPAAVSSVYSFTHTHTNKSCQLQRRATYADREPQSAHPRP